MGPVHIYTPKSFCFSNKTKQKEFVTDTPSPNVPLSIKEIKKNCQDRDLYSAGMTLTTWDHIIEDWRFPKM